MVIAELTSYDYYCYIRPKDNWDVAYNREIKVRAHNYGEAEALAAMHLQNDEYIAKIECELN